MLNVRQTDMLSKSKILESEPLCLRATGMGITEIDILTAHQAEAISLFVSQNSIEHIPNIGQFHELQRLMMAFNKIRLIEDLLPLGNVPTLRELNLEGNPVCRLPLFLYHILNLLPRLEKLNGRDVSSYKASRYSREQIEEMIRCEAELLRNIALCEVVLVALRKYPKNSIPSVNELFQEMMTPMELVQFYDGIRRKAINFPPGKYFKYLRGILLNRHKDIHEVAVEKGIDQNIVSIHQARMASVSESEQMDKMTEDFNNLNLLTAQMVEIPEENDSMIVSSRKSRMSMSFGQGERLSSRIKIQKKAAPPKPKKSKSRKSRRSSAASRSTANESVTKEEVEKVAEDEVTEVHDDLLGEEEDAIHGESHAKMSEEEDVQQLGGHLSEEERLAREGMNAEEEDGDDAQGVHSGAADGDDEFVNKDVHGGEEEEDEEYWRRIHEEEEEAHWRRIHEEEEEEHWRRMHEEEEDERDAEAGIANHGESDQEEREGHDVQMEKSVEEEEEVGENENAHKVDEEEEYMDRRSRSNAEKNSATNDADRYREMSGSMDANSNKDRFGGDRNSISSHSSSRRGAINYADLAYSFDAKKAFDKLMAQSKGIDFTEGFESRPPPSLDTMKMRIKELTERHNLMRKIEHQENLNDAAKRRLSQMSNECSFKKTTYGFQ